MSDGGKTIIQPMGPTAEAGELPKDMYVSIEVIEGPDKGMKANLTKSRTVMGRNPGDVQFNDPTVSGTHAAIEYAGNEIYVADQNSSNGTQVNGEPVQRVVLSNMDEIKMGNTKLLFCVVKDVYGTFTAEPPPEEVREIPQVDPNSVTDPRRQIPNPELPTSVRVLLYVAEGPDAGQRFLLTRQHTTIGRTDNVDVQLHDEAVSRHHCQIMITSKYVMGIKDLGSTNGTFINGRFASAVKLTADDTIQVGDTKLRIIAFDKQGPG